MNNKQMNNVTNNLAVKLTLFNSFCKISFFFLFQYKIKSI